MLGHHDRDLRGLKLCVPDGASRQASGGEIFVPSQLYVTGISWPLSNAGLESAKGMAPALWNASDIVTRPAAPFSSLEGPGELTLRDKRSISQRARGNARTLANGGFSDMGRTWKAMTRHEGRVICLSH